jgi:hypothetical protein
MIEDVKLSVDGKVRVALHNRMGGMVPSPEEVFNALITSFSI